MEGFKVNLTMLACYVASVISITLKSPGTDLGEGGCAGRKKKKRIDLRISEKKKKGLGHNPKAQSQADQEKTSQDFKTKIKSIQQRQYLL